MSEYEDMLGDAPPRVKKAETKKKAQPAKKLPRRSAAQPPPPTVQLEAEGEEFPQQIAVAATPRKNHIILPDKRRLNQKQQEALVTRWSDVNAAATRSEMMTSLLNRARDKFGQNHVFASREELQQLAIGIPMPSLAFEYLLANDVFPLSSVMMLAGTWGTCKSALSYEIFRWFYERQGISVHIDTEFKFDADFACDIMRVARNHMPIISNKADSTEVWQQMLTHYVRELQRDMVRVSDNEVGPGKKIPVCCCVDSIGGTQSQEVLEKVQKDGTAGRVHPITALMNSNYLPAIKSELDDWPFTLLLINHLKEKTDQQGNAHRYTLGGQAFNFHESFEVQTGVWRSKIKNAQFEGIGIELRCSKNSFGPTGRRIKTRFIWWVEDDPETGDPRDVFLWDWNWALVTLLHELEGTGQQRLKARDLHINCQSPKADLECLANFPALGMGKEYLPFSEVGQMIQDNPEVCDRIRDALNIKRRKVLPLPYEAMQLEHKTRKKSK